MPKTEDAVVRRHAPGRALWLLGPAMVAGVAYLDPGNVASNMTAGAAFGYLLVWVVVLGNVMAWLIQYLSAKLGIVTGESLPQILGRRMHRPWGRRLYWLQAEAVAMATDVAEVIGGAVALHLLFDIPLVWGGAITGVVSMGLLLVQTRRGARAFETVLIGMLVIIAVGFSFGLLIAPPDAAGVAAGLVPRFEGTNSVLLAASILGATIMPHAIYAHSALARDRFAPDAATFAQVGHTASARSAGAGADGPPATGTSASRAALEHARGISTPRLLRATRWDVTIALAVAGTVNLAILLLAAANLAGVDGTDSLEGAYAALRDGLGPWSRRCSPSGCSRAASPRPRSAPTPAPRSCTDCCGRASHSSSGVSSPSSPRWRSSHSASIPPSPSCSARWCCRSASRSPWCRWSP